MDSLISMIGMRNMSTIEPALKILAKREGISVAALKKEIQAAINEAYSTPNLYARQVPSKKDIPTVEEFLEYAARKAILRMKEE